MTALTGNRLADAALRELESRENTAIIAAQTNGLIRMRQVLDQKPFEGFQVETSGWEAKVFSNEGSLLLTLSFGVPGMAADKDWIRYGRSWRSELGGEEYASDTQHPADFGEDSTHWHLIGEYLLLFGGLLKREDHRITRENVYGDSSINREDLDSMFPPHRFEWVVYVYETNDAEGGMGSAIARDRRGRVHFARLDHCGGRRVSDNFTTVVWDPELNPTDGLGAMISFFKDKDSVVSKAAEMLKWS
jgi:hypothetical protein